MKMIACVFLLALTAQAQVPNCGCLSGWQYVACMLGAYIDCSGADPGIPGVPPRATGACMLPKLSPTPVSARVERIDLSVLPSPVVMPIVLVAHGPVMPPPDPSDCPNPNNPMCPTGVPPPNCGCLGGWQYIACLAGVYPTCDAANRNSPGKPVPPPPPAPGRK